MAKDRPRRKPPAPGTSRAARAAFPIIAFVAFLLAYLPARNMPFFFDDRVTIVQNAKIQSHHLADVLSENPFRSIPNLTFALQLHLQTNKTLPPGAYSLAAVTPYIQTRFSDREGRYLAFYNDPVALESIPISVDPGRGIFFPLPDAQPFRLFNLVLHFLNAALIFLILRRLIPEREAVAAAAAVVFLFHPLATEPVDYITARMGLMAVTFSLSAVLFHLLADQDPRSDLGAVVAFVLALLCKETAAVLPLIVFFLDCARGRPHFIVLAALGLSALYAALRLFAWPVVPEGSGGATLPMWRYLLVEQRVLMLYLADLFLPIHLNFDPDIVPRLAPDVICAVINTVLLAASAVVIVRTARSGRARPSVAPAWAWPAAVVLMAWIAMAPAASIVPLSDLAKEERAYPLLVIIVPALAAASLSLAGAKQWTPRSIPRRRAAVAALAVIFLGFAALTVSRNRQWKNERTLTRAMVEDSPQKARPLYQYATALKWAGNIKDALFWYEQSLRLDPQNQEARTNIMVLQKELSGGKEP